MSQIYPVDVAEITTAIETMFKEDDELVGLTTTVVRGEPINESSEACPWLGVYRTGVTYPARTLGHGSGYRRQQVALVVIVQESDPNSGALCEERLERLIKHVVRVLLSDETLRGKVDTLDSFEVQYTNYGIDDNTQAFMQQAAVQFVGLINVTRA